MSKITMPELKQQLSQFTGTERYYKHLCNTLYTEGVKALADLAGAYWLIDAISSYQPRYRELDFQLWKLVVADDNSAVLTMREDSPLLPIVSQDIKFTDFPVGEIEIYVMNGVIFLPSEY